MGCGDSHMLRAAHSDSPLRSPFPFGAAEAASRPAPATPAELKKARRDMPATPLRGRMSYRFILSSLHANGLKFVASCRKHTLDVRWTLASGSIGANAQEAASAPRNRILGNGLSLFLAKQPCQGQSSNWVQLQVGVNSCGL